MQPDRRRQLVLAVLLVVLTAVLYRAWPRTAAPAGGTSNPRSTARAGQAPGIVAPDVKLEALDADRPKPDGPTRNLFRFGRPPAPPPGRPPDPVTTALPPKPVLPGPPSVAPIPLKFVGTMQVGQRLMAVLSDGTGRDPVYGFEGDTILGQYRLVRVGAEAVEMSYLDGRGRQTIRFSGS